VGLFDFLKRGPRPEAQGSKAERKLDSLIRSATDKRAQQYDRDEALRKLVAVGTPEAAEGLLKRFSVKVDPSITDEDEKQMAYEGIVSIGQGLSAPAPGGSTRTSKEDGDENSADAVRGAVIDYARAYCKTAENLTWAIKVLRALQNDEEYEHELLSLLLAHDTEYTRNVEPKVNLLAALESLRGEAVRKAVEGYLADVNETVRFHAVQTLFEQGDPSAIDALLDLLLEEESVRVKNKIADGLVRKSWRVPAARQDAFRRGMADSYAYALSDDGSVVKV